MSLEIRAATPDDFDTVVSLFYAIDIHYWGQAAPSKRAIAEHVSHSIMSAKSCEVVLAEIDGRPVGLATFTVLDPGAETDRQFLVKELFVVEGMRGEGIGQALMRNLAVTAKARNCLRLDWTAESTNLGALAFYDNIGARRITDGVAYRFDGAALDAFVGQA